MKRPIIFLCASAAVLFGKLEPVSFEKVSLQDDFWLPRMELQKRVLVPVAFERTAPGRENLVRAGKILKGEATPLPTGTSRFDTSDYYKVLEGAAYLLKIERDPALEKKIDEAAAIIAAAMEPDGYIYPPITGKAIDCGRYQDILHNHELYNMGHLYEAAAAYYLATGKRNLLDIAEKNARHIKRAFFEGGNPKYNGGKPVNKAPGHQEIELALIKLYDITGNREYLDLAKKFLDIRGITYSDADAKLSRYGHLKGSYAQQHLPVREQTEAVGHAVRATYMYSAMADAASRTGDASYLPALRKIWSDIVNKKMHITGGLGAVAGIEGFGAPYELPNATAYDETCAAIGNIFFNYRMFLLERDAKFVDVAEVALFNNTLAGVSFSGDKFFYANPLENYGHTVRPPWYGCACCPTNLARVIPQVSGMMYAFEGNAAYCALYASSEARLPLSSGEVALRQKTDYPFGGDIEIEVSPAYAKQFFELKLRIPTWAGHKFVPGDLYSYVGEEPARWSVSVNGRRLAASEVSLERGFASIKRKWKSGDVVKLHLPMRVRFNKAIERVEADRGRICITRGPVVYCAEGADNPAPANVWCFNEDAQQPIVEKQTAGVLKGIPTIKNISAKYIDKGGEIRAGKLALIPYYAWNNRGEGTMNVWFADNEKTLKENKNALTAYNLREYADLRATYTFAKDDIKNTVLAGLPSASADAAAGKWSSERRPGEKQSLTYTFNRTTSVAEISAYFYQGGKIRLPQSWSAEYLDESGKWQKFPIYLTDSYSALPDQFNAVHPSGEPIKARAVRINIVPQPKSAAGVLRVLFK